MGPHPLAHAVPIFIFYATYAIAIGIGPAIAVAIVIARLRDRRRWNAPGLDLSALTTRPADLQDPQYADRGDPHTAARGNQVLDVWGEGTINPPRRPPNSDGVPTGLRPGPGRTPR
jgi:hypothetical protein